MLPRSGCAEMDGNVFDDLNTEALERGDVGGVVGEQADLAYAEVGEDLAAEADLAEDALGVARGCLLAGVALTAMEEKAGGCGVVDAEAALGLVEIDERSTTCCGNGGE